jgi:peptidoglycan/xylan/chitin deacetylase (PgdA/CDA1 family)
MLTDSLASIVRGLKRNVGAGAWLGQRRDRLTVICYHRVWPSEDGRFAGYKPTISATPGAFTKQIDFIRRHYNPISAQTLANWIEGAGTLPPRPALVTFDDGYRDNAEIAWPILRERNVPAVIFLATDYIGTGRSFLWDFAACCFEMSAKKGTEIPLIGWRSLATEAERNAVVTAWVAAAKRLPGVERDDARIELAAALDVAPPGPERFEHLYMDWTDVQRLAHEGAEFGAHTHSHPILTRVPLDQARTEIEMSVDRLTTALGVCPLSFAYPNGSARDFGAEHEEAVRRTGVSMAFSLEPGPVSLDQVRKRPMAIRRIYIGQHDGMIRFIVKLKGVARLGRILRREG